MRCSALPGRRLYERLLRRRLKLLSHELATHTKKQRARRCDNCTGDGD